MLYSQHVLGIGHFFRSMEIARALHGHEVMFVEGGDPLVDFTTPPHVRRFFLPSLMMDADFKSMEARSGSLDEIKKVRMGLFLDAFLDFNPHVLITELFPFGRRQFRFELMPVLQAIRNQRMSTRVVCSLRDILVEKAKQSEYERWVLDILNTHYDLLLIHSDPRIISLDETFTQMDKILVPIHYTGFVTRPIPAVGKLPGRRVIVASSGGGKVGTDLLEAAIQAVQSMTDRSVCLKVFLGPFMDEGEKGLLVKLAGADPRTTLHPFSSDFLSELMASDLSISMAGYNTCMDILSAGVKAIVYPFPQNREQALRARRLETLGLLKVIREVDSESLEVSIREALAETFPGASPRKPLDLAGAARTRQFITSP